MKILAIDPGYDRMGAAILEKREKGKELLLFSECVTTSPSLPHYERLALIGKAIAQLIKTYSPDVLAIEKLFFSKNQKTALLVAEARGAILSEAGKAGLAVFEYHPSEIKIAVTSSGKSDKAQVSAMVKKLIAISHEIKHDDEYDAIAIGLTHAAHIQLSPTKGKNPLQK